jgi:hypothetical protein
MKKVLLTICLMFKIVVAICQENTPNKQFIHQLLQERKDLFGKILQNPNKFQVQVIYTQINRDQNNVPTFREFHYRVDKSFYFYPASTIKFPAAILALEKINELNINGFTKDARMQIDSGYIGQTKVLYDSTSESLYPSIAHYIKKLLVVSDNDAYNRLYEFLGQKYLNDKLKEKGFANTKIVHRLSVGDSGEKTRYTNPMSFYNEGKVVYNQPLTYNEKTYNSYKLKNLMMGKGFIRQKTLVKEPMNFSTNNYISLEDLHHILRNLLFPESISENQRFKLTESDYKFLYKYMGILPKECDYPDYKQDTTYTDHFAKFLMYGDGKTPIPAHIRIYNKIGMAYGFLIDNAYIVDFENKVEFMLSAVIHVNENQIFNDGVYEYESIGLPFLANLGRIIYEYELKRTKQYVPNLQRFVID